MRNQRDRRQNVSDSGVASLRLWFLLASDPAVQLTRGVSLAPSSLVKFFSEDAAGTLCHNPNKRAARTKGRDAKYSTDGVILELLNITDTLILRGHSGAESRGGLLVERRHHFRHFPIAGNITRYLLILYFPSCSCHR